VADLSIGLTTPETLNNAHDVSTFKSGESVLDEWLQKRAFDNMAAGASRCYVTRQAESSKVAAYYALSMGSISANEVTGSMRRNMPRLIPSVVLGRLAVDLTFQGNGLGAMLLQDAVMRALRASSEISARLVLAHAISQAAEAFYVHHGFARTPVAEPLLALDLVKFAKQAKR
jgi:GNAT superfamily N-acetyltransferase